MKRPAARLLQPPRQKQTPLTRAEAECKLAEVLGKGNRDLYAKYVYKRTKQLSQSQIRLLVIKFTEGDQYDFERTFERLFGGRPMWTVELHPAPRRYGDVAREDFE